jgi:hypothetical protein
MTAAIKKAPVEASELRRDGYSTPHLVHYGPLRSLTTAGTGTQTEPTGSGNPNRRP